MESGSSGRCRFVARLICIVTAGLFAALRRRYHRSSAADDVPLLSRAVPPLHPILFGESGARRAFRMRRPALGRTSPGGSSVAREIES